MRQIVSRLTQTLDEDSKTGAKLTNIYKGLGIAVNGTDGQIRSTYDILADLSKQWNSLSKNEQEYIALTSAGSNQVENFNALMTNFSTAIAATETAENSAGSAMKENSKYMESLSAKLNALKGQLQELVIGDGSLSAFMKGVVDAGTAILKFANSDVGKTILQITLLYTTFTLAAKGVAKFQKAMADTEATSGLVGLVKNIKAAITAFKGAETAADGFKAALGALNINPVVLAITGIATAGLIAYKVYKKLNPSLEELSKRAEESKQAFDDQKQEVEETTTKIDELNQKIDEINKKGKLTLTDENQLTLLKSEKVQLENQLAIQNKLLENKRKQAEEDAKKVLNKKGNVQESSFNQMGDERYSANGQLLEFGATHHKTDVAGQVTENIKYYNQAQQALKGYIAEYERLNAIQEKDRTPEQQAQLEEYKSAIDSTKQALDYYNDAILKSGETLNTQVGTVTSLGGNVKDLGSDVATAYDAFSQWAVQSQNVDTSLTSTDDVVQKINDTLNTNYKSTDDVAKALEDAGGSSDQFKNDLSDITKYGDAVSVALKGLQGDLGDTGDAENEFSDETGDAEEQVVTFADALNTSMSNISSIQSAYGNLKAAVDEYNKSGQISFETLSNIISQNPAYLACLDDSSGKLSINEAMLEQQFNAQKQAAIATLEAARSYAIEQVQLGATADEAIGMALSSQQLTTQVGESGTAASNASTSYSNAGSAASGASGGINSMTGAVTGLTGAMSDGIAMGNQYNNMLKGAQGNSSAKGSYSYKGTTPGGMPSDVYNQWKKSKDDAVNKNAEKVNKKFDSIEKTIKNLSWKNIKVTANVPSSGGGSSRSGGSKGSKGKSGGSGSSKKDKALKNAQDSASKSIQKRINKLKKEKKALEDSNKAMQAEIDKLDDEKDHFDDLKGYIDDAFDEQIDDIDKQLDTLEKKYDRMTVGEGFDEKLSDIAPKFDDITTSADQAAEATKNFNTAVSELTDKYKDMKISDALDDVKEKLDEIEKQVDDYKKQQEIIRNSTVYAGKLAEYQGKTYKELKRTLVLKQREKEDDADILRYTEQITDLQYKLNLSENEGSIKQKTDQVTTYQNQIDALQKQIDDQKEINDELDKQIERQKLLDALSAAKNKRLKVYQKGKGFTYTQDFDAIKKAQDDLDSYDREHKTDDLQKQIDDLEKKQKVLNDEITKEKDYYQKQIDALQWAKDKKEKLYDDQINDLQRFIDDCDDKYDDATDDTVDAYLIQQKARKDDLENQEYYLEKLQNALDKEYEAQKENLEDTKQMVQDKKDAFDKEYEAYEKHVQAVELFKEAGIEEGKSMLDQTTALDTFVDHAIAKYKELDKAKKTYNPQISQNKKSISQLDKDIDKQGEYKDQAKNAKTAKGAKKANDKSKTAYNKTNKKVVSNTNLGSYKATMQQKAADLQGQVDNGTISTEEAAKAFNTANKKAKKKYGLKDSEGYKDKELDTKRWGNVTTEQQRIDAGGKLTPAKYQKETGKTDKKGNKVRIGTSKTDKISIQSKVKKPLTTTAKMGTVKTNKKTTTTPKKKTTTGKKTTTSNKGKKTTTTNNKKKTTTSNKKKTTTNKKKTPKTKKKYTGDSSISKSGVYLVGDKPSQELVIGSKLNGVPLNLDKGTGVVNAKSTSTLAGMLNTLSSDKEHIGTLNKNTSTTNNDNLSIGSVTVSGANIDDGESFVASLKTLKQEALQRAYRK